MPRPLIRDQCINEVQYDRYWNAKLSLQNQYIGHDRITTRAAYKIRTQRYKFFVIAASWRGVCQIVHISAE
jgi:hypothetical protein